ncbi:MAG TPA: winged helix-turn-helix domain-containing protein [Rhodothermales bacterium]|nr:winged helix-turn-helix domain-containing protein [Rhodothermales bacterium]
MQETLIYRFRDFTLDVTNRELLLEEERLDINARYFDALVLLVREHGRLVEKDRFFEEVWDDVVVSDGALTQCIKEIRRQLGDDASNPRFIQTVPRHGYRFIAEVSTQELDAVVDAPDAVTDVSGSMSEAGEISMSAEGDGAAAAIHLTARSESAFSMALATALAGTLGGTLAGLLGGLLFGFGLAYSPMDQELGTASVLLVLISLTGFLGTVGGFGIGAGMAAAEYAAGGRTAWRIVGAMLGGMLIGGSVKLLGVDAFNLLFGQTPAGITGGMEGAALGLAVGLGAHLGGGLGTAIWWRPVVAAAAAGAVIGVVIALSGGHLMGGSLNLLAQSFSESRLQLDAFGRYFGEVRFGQTTQVVLAGIEGLIFAACVVGALVASRLSRKAPSATS